MSRAPGTSDLIGSFVAYAVVCAGIGAAMAMASCKQQLPRDTWSVLYCRETPRDEEKLKVATTADFAGVSDGMWLWRGDMWLSYKMAPGEQCRVANRSTPPPTP